ncbi:hypothetical protein PhaeoP88_04045 (plasmid) [Phaeobacter inhibens]|uniref:Uncharacterized protein n=1 Tax=Phaeobacter inhibens TaxID=221822 RepID=A0A2I7KFI9_9RHOB|nr:hypothetical protein PhaeoP88_04045 [Phaeobacter inhibens]
MHHIQTTYHPSGRYTCMERHENETMWRDLPGELFGNPNRAEFYNGVSQYVEKLRSVGRLASFDDLASRVEE